MDIATDAAVADNDDDAVGAVIPPSSTKNQDAYISASVAFEGLRVGAFADSAGLLGNNSNVESAVGKGEGGGSSAPWGTWLVAAPVDSIIMGDAIVIAIIIVIAVVVVSRNVAAEGGVGVATPPLLSSLSTSAAVVALFVPLNVHRSTSHHPTLTLCGARPVNHHHCPPVCAPPTTFHCRLPPLLIVKCPLRCRHQ